MAALSELFSTIRHHPNQIIVLHSGNVIAGLDPRQPGYLQAFERQDVPAGIRTTAAAIDRAEAGEEDVLAQLRERWFDANVVMDGMFEGAGIIAPELPEIAAMFTADELRRCRTKAPYTEEMTAKVFRSAFQLYEALVDQAGRLPVLDPIHAIQTYYYRLSLGTMLHGLWWIQNGSQPIKRLERLRNDYIDLGLAVCATYYDDLLTADAKARWLYRELINALRFAKYKAMEA